jgi:hypothetical protein
MRKSALLTSVLAVGLLGGCAQPVSTYSANLFGASEVPPTLATGSGAVTLELANAPLSAGPSVYQVIRYTVVFSGLSGEVTAGGINCPAAPGSNAPRSANFDGKITSPYSAVESINPTLAGFIASGQCYVNLHTLQYPTGEVRGWLTAQ